MKVVLDPGAYMPEYAHDTDAGAVAEGCPAGTQDCAYQHDKLVDWLEELERLRGVLGDTYDLDRLRELVEADKAGRFVVLPVKPGETVRFAKNPRAKPEKVSCVMLYEEGKISLGFHDVGYKSTWVDEWSEDDAENYVPVGKEADHE